LIPITRWEGGAPIQLDVGLLSFPTRDSRQLSAKSKQGIGQPTLYHR
jgi:hypothetical protein